MTTLNLSEMTREQMIELVAKQQATIEAQRKAAEKPIRMKITAPKLNEKTGKMEGSTGAISVYGLQQFPVTLYASQWERLFGEIDNIKAFIATNAALVARK